MATGADWMSAASFVGMAGTLFLLGYDGLAWVLGWTGGFVLVSILVGPYLRKFGAYTVPDFMAFRYGGNFARFLAVDRAGVLLLHVCDGADLRHRPHRLALPRHEFEIAVFVGLVGILLCAMLGGMRAVTWTQIAQYIVLIIAYLDADHHPVDAEVRDPDPSTDLRAAIAEITAREEQMVRRLAVLCEPARRTSSRTSSRSSTTRR